MTAFNEDWLEQHNARMARLRSAPAAAAVPVSVERTQASPPVRLNKSPADAGMWPAREAAGERNASPKSKQRPEEEIQKQVAAYLDVALPPPYRWLHIPNQRGTRTKWENQLLKAMGVKAGAADVLIFTPGGRFIWIELKAPNGILSTEQKSWRDWAVSIGAPWFLCRSLDDVIEALESLQIRLLARAS